MFKLIPGTQGSSICLRCQCRLTARPKSRSSRRLHVRHPQQLRRFTSGPSLGQEQQSFEDAATDKGTIERAPIRYCFEDWDPKRSNRPTKNSLGLNVLGEPAEVLVLRDRQYRIDNDIGMGKIRATGPDRNPVQEPTSSSGLMEKMNAERGIIGIDEVCNNIENVRASWAESIEGNITGLSYHDLFTRLCEGFTKQQLAAYLTRNDKNPIADVFDLSAEISNSLYTRSSWQRVGETAARQSKAPKIADKTPYKDFNTAEDPGKERFKGWKRDDLVQRLLRRCWNISPRFQESLIGELDLRVQESHLNLILNHRRDILKLISRSYDSKVEAWPQDRIIRITSDYDNCVDILKLLVHTLENIRSSTIEIDVNSTSEQDSVPSPKKLNDVMLRLIENYTDTLVRPQGPSRTEFRVFYLGPDDADLLETQRLMHQILGPATANYSKLASSTLKLPDVVPIPVDVGTRLSVLVRNQQWSRWCQTQKLEGRQEDGPRPERLLEGPASQAMHGPLAFSIVKSFFEAPDDTSYMLCLNDYPYWKSDIEYHDSATLGQVLLPTKMAGIVSSGLEHVRGGKKGLNHKRKKNDPIMRAIRLKDITLQCSDQPREFVHLVPGLVRSLENVESRQTTEELLQIRLSPSTKNLSLPVPVAALPDLEIRVSFDQENRTTFIKDVRLVNAREKDFLQPQNVVDLRFTRKQCVYAKDGSIDPSITSFVQDSNLDIWGTERLKTPLGLSISIPALAIKPHKNFDPTVHESLQVDYTSFGLEHRSFLTMPYREPDSWPTLTYTNVEAGRIGGRRDELSLHNLRFASKPLPPQPTTTTDSAHPDHLPVRNETLSNEDHTDILLQKTASLIAAIDLANSAKPANAVMPRSDNIAYRLDQMPGVRHWRPVKEVRLMVRKIPKSTDGYASPGAAVLRMRKMVDHLVKPSKEPVEGE